MATPDDSTDTQTQAPPAATSPDMLAQAMQLAKQFMPQPVQQDTTPVSRSWTSLLGEALGGGPPVSGMTDTDRELAGHQALMQFGTGLMAASRYQPGQTIFSNLAGGFQGAERGEVGAEEMAMSRLGAQQEYAQQQAQNKLEAIKTALPFLTLQNQMRISGQPNPLAGNAPSTNVAQGGSIADPAAALPKDQALAAVVQRESGGKNIPTAILGPDGKPASTATGYYQMLDNTWQEGAALAGIKNPPARAMDASKADQDAAASALYDKYKLMPWAKSAPTPTAPSGVPPASTASTTPPAPVVHTSPTLRGPGTPVPPTPQPSIQGVPDTGGTQVGGPGAKAGPIAPPGPAVPGDVNAIIAGMKGAGAAPTTLAPGAATAGPAAQTIAQGGPPTVTPPAQPTPQVSTQQPTDTRPDAELTQEQYIARHFVPATDADRQTFTVPVNPASVQAAQLAVQGAQRAQAAAAQDRQNAITPEARATAGQNYTKATEALQTANATLADIQGKADTATSTAAAKFAEDQRARLTTTYNQMVHDKTVGDQAIALKKLEGQQAIQQAGVTSDVQAGQKALEAVNATRDGAQDTVNNLEVAKNFSKLAGTSGFLQQWPQVRNMLVRNNLLSSDDVQQMGAQQGLDAVMNKVILSMRAGSGMSRMTNFDLQFLQNTAPNSFTPDQMRPAMFAAIQTAATRQVEYADRVNELHANGMPVWQARQQADTDLGHMVKETPTTYPQGDPRAGQPMSADDQNKWIIRNVTPGTFYTQPNGALAIRGEPKQAQQ